MTARANFRYIAPSDPQADKACRLTQEAVALRREPPDGFFALAKSQSILGNGYELRFSAAPDLDERIDAFIAEESECCPFSPSSAGTRPTTGCCASSGPATRTPNKWPR